ncbi:hypothetical protein FRB97_005729 [Tulasnella sp. 331]|nr:hypothetical protein FRB97_005729 [Tulasnella sp. 331]
MAAAVLTPPILEQKRACVAAVSTAVENSYTPYEWPPSAAYCTNGGSWSARGSTCAANSNFIQYATGGDGDATHHWYVGCSPSLESIIVPHEGTDPTQFLSDLTGTEILTAQLPSAQFHGTSSALYGNIPPLALITQLLAMTLLIVPADFFVSHSLGVDEGFLKAFEMTAATILAGVKTIVSARASSKITVVGHSLGSALSNLYSVHLNLRIPSSTIKIVTFGEPGVGNQAWAEDAGTFDLTSFTYNDGPIPTLSEGEIHIKAAGMWNARAGEDNINSLCSTGQVADVFDYNIVDHLRPYGPIAAWMGTIYCQIITSGVA